MFQLQPNDISDVYTITEINERIEEIKTAIKTASDSAMDSFSDTQAQQTVKRQKLSDLRSELAVYIKAKNILAGADSGSAILTSADYNPRYPRV